MGQPFFLWSVTEINGRSQGMGNKTTRATAGWAGQRIEITLTLIHHWRGWKLDLRNSCQSLIFPKISKFTITSFVV